MNHDAKAVQARGRGLLPALLLVLGLLGLSGLAAAPSGRRVAAQVPPTAAVTPLPAPVATAEPEPAEQIQETLEARVLAATPPQPCAPSPVDAAAPPGTPPGHCQRVDLLITSGSLHGQQVVVEEGRIPVASKTDIRYQPGDQVLVDWYHSPGQPDTFYITDFIRTGGLFVLALLFVAVAVLMARLRGLSSLLGLIISFAVVLYFILPRIIAGDDPVVVSIIGAAVIILVTLYLSHGFNWKTTAAILGTTISLVLTGLLGAYALNLARLTGFGSEETAYIQVVQGGTLNLRGLLLGGIIIGALGVLNDITIGQASAVFELHQVDPRLGWRALFGHVTNIGRDHIAATVNTLVLAYAGASLPLLLLFVSGDESWLRVINREVVADEIVRALVGSIGLIAAVPITTVIASLLAVRTPARPRSAEEIVHHHTH